MHGSRGAPLDDDEIARIEASLPFAVQYLDPVHRAYIDTHGYYEGKRGDYTTKCIDNRACVFVFYQNGIARCSLEQAFNNGESKWKKPISCHLFPIRISNGKPTMVRYEQIPECKPGVRKGELENIRLVQFLEEPLRRHFGDGWYLSLVSEKNGVES